MTDDIAATAEREAKIRREFDRTMRLIEIGASHRPIVPKSDGWQTTVIDHAEHAELIEKYRELGEKAVERIEPVDHVWRDGPLTSLIPADLHGTFDGLVASHVGEHLPDLIGFFQAASAVLKPGGLIALALPDKRVCFDIFQPLTRTGDLVEAHRQGRMRHQRRTFFNQTAYFTTRDGSGGWSHALQAVPLQLANSLATAQLAFDSADDRPESHYQDTHAWAFTPKSFELLILELNLLRYIDWTIKAIEPAGGTEFYIWLERQQLQMPETAINLLRLRLLRDNMREFRTMIDEFDVQHLMESLRNYKAALLNGDRRAITAAWTAAWDAAARVPGHHKLRTTLRLLRNPAVSRCIFAARRIARPMMMWAFQFG